MIDENGYIRCDCVRGKILAQLKGDKLIFHCRGCKQDYVLNLQELLDKYSNSLTTAHSMVYNSTVKLCGIAPPLTI